MRNAVFWGLAGCWGTAAARENAHRPDAALNATSHTATPGTIRDDHSQSTARRRLHGRFLHITDFHPDPYYKTYSSTKAQAACHRKRGPAGYYGAETSGCDSPLSLVNATMDWIKHNIADDIDFVIWTGDSARHDNDDKRPRTRRQVVQQNELMVDKFVEVFGTKKGHGSSDVFRIPIVPTFGNNDIMPHNILLKGPNEWTMKYLDIWRGMVPEAQRHQFQQGGWYSVEVIPGKLAVISLNTMYFFTSNSGVDGCANKHEPGYEQFEWLRIQLQIMRDRGMSAILIGHVPPARVNSKESWEDTCWQKYALWERQYRDVILASLFGHMNIDHFMLQDFKKIKKGAKKGLMGSKRVKSKKKANAVELLEDGEVTVASASDYLLDLRKTWAKIPSPSSKESRQSSAEFDESLDEYEEVEEAEEEEASMWSRISNFFSRSKKGGKKPKKGKTYLEKIGGEYAERYSVSLVSPSVVPNYFPTLRIFTYNTTGLEDIVSASQSESPRSTSSIDQDREQTPILPSLPPTPIDVDIDADIPDYDDNNDDDTAYLRYINAALKRKRKDKERESLKKKKKYKFKVPAAPSKSAPPGPAYSPQPLTLLSYTQYFANLTQINNDFVTASPPPSTLQTTNADAPSTIFGLALSRSPDDDDTLRIEPRGWKEGKHHKHQGKKPRPKPHPKPFSYEVEYDTRSDERYGLEDLTVRRWVELAGRLGRKDGGKSKSSSVDTNDEDDDVVEEKGGKKKKKKKHKHGKHPKVDQKSPWFTFVRRAFVGSMDPREIDAVFGGRAGVSGGWDGEDVYDVDVEEEGEEQADGDEVMEL